MQKQKARKQRVDVTAVQGFLAFEIVVTSVPQSNKPNPIKGFFPVIGFVKIAVDKYDFNMILIILFIMQLQQKEQRMSLE